MQRVETLVALPGHCIICRSAKPPRECFIDTEISIDYEGAVCICNECVGEMARLLMFISQDDYKDLRKSKEDLEHLNFELIKRVGALEGSLRALADAGYKYTPDNGVVIDGGYSPQNAKAGKGQLHQTAGDMEQGKRKSPESNDDEDLAGLRTSQSDSDLEFQL
jgi:hypothetical protein